MSLPSRFSWCVEGSSSPGTAGSGICFTQTTTCMVGSLRKEVDGPFWQGSCTPVETATLAQSTLVSTVPGVPTTPRPDQSTVLDVLVVGAGPAGVAAAITAQQQGMSVACLDRATFPRDKTCGDGLTASALRLLEDLGLDPGAVPGWEPVAGVVLRSPSGRVVDLP